MRLLTLLFALSLFTIHRAVSLAADSFPLNGADISSLLVLETQGITFSEQGRVEPFETILAKHNFKLARIRVWTAGNYTQSYGIALAKRVKASGMKILLDLHYSDTWADPGHQAIPSAWPKNLTGLNSQIFTYTKDLVKAFATAGVAADYIQIGNEINDGLLWPVGQISVSGFQGASELLHSAAKGVRLGSPDTKIVVHIANGWDAGGVNFFWDGIFMPGAFQSEDLDIMGFSFYPFYGVNATLDALRASLKGVASQFTQDILVAETDWRVACPSSVALSEPDIPLSTSGQQSWVHDIENILTELPMRRGLGVVYWEPGWVGSSSLGSPCSDALLVDERGAVRTSVNLF